jgi:DNA polymerase I-like protein with 3'-5' exonuclease and polymerase domains
MTYAILDIETTSKKDLARGLHPYGLNDIVLIGGKREKNNCEIMPGGTSIHLNADYIVGHNLAFDLGFLLANGNLHPNDFKSVPWDTQIFHYLWLGQKKYPSLEEAAEYWCPGEELKKTADIGDLIEQYGDTDKIPRVILDPYLEMDLILTEKVFQAQWRQLEFASEDVTFLIMSEMLACKENILATCNGIPLHMEKLALKKVNLLSTADLLRNRFIHEIEKTISSSTAVKDPDIINSTKFAQQLIYADTATFDVVSPTGFYKSGLKKGQVKWSTSQGAMILQGTKVTPLDGSMSTDEENIQKYLKFGDPHSNRVTLLKMILEYRSVTKALGTYCANLEKYQIAGVLHPGFQQVSTGTGRASAVKPNIQNQP